MLRLLSVSAVLLLLGFAPTPSSRLVPDLDQAIDQFDREARHSPVNSGPDDDSLSKRKESLLHRLSNLEDRLRKTGANDAAHGVRDRLVLLKTLDADKPLGDATSADLLRKASSGGKYKKLLHVLHVPADRAQFAENIDFGYWPGTAYQGYSDLQPGHWVYVYPRWFVWTDGPQR